MKKLIAIAVLLIPIGLTSQSFTAGYITNNNLANMSTVALEWGEDVYKTSRCSPELRGGKLFLKWETHEACFAATIPGCAGHDTTWIDVYSASNGVVVLERKLEPRWVTKQKTIETQELEWPQY